MKIPKRTQTRILECYVAVAFVINLFWWHSGIVFLLSAVYFVGSYLWYRREAVLNYRFSEATRSRMTVNDVEAIEKKYTLREDFNTFEKRALARSPVDRYFYYARYERVQQLLETYANGVKRILDMGCGFGEHTVYIRKRLKCVAIGLELDSMKLEEAGRVARRASLTDGITFLSGDACHPPFRASSFDCILLTEVLEHLIDPSQGLAACHYLLDSGGILVISTPSRHGLKYSSNPFVIFEKGLSLISDRILPPCHNLHGQFEFNWRNPEPEYGMHYNFSWQQLEILLQKTGFQTIYRGSFEIEIPPFLLMDLITRSDLRQIKKYVGPLEILMQKMPLVRRLGQHLLWVAQKSHNR